ncbi:YwiC-like family protein [Trueperella sp. LYQ143]|uniref:YwiC-like family protein n=1 Tax=unclassified Trueperella TaxID=2630174 RepID=UPI00398377C9
MSTLASRGWLPNYHGAWAMVTLPILSGVVLGGWRWPHLLLLSTWWLGYFAFFATGQWLRSRGKARYRPAMFTYLGISLPLGGMLLFLEPYLFRWAPIYLPLILITAWCSYRRADRSMTNNTVTVIAACLTLPVAYDLATKGSGSWWGLAFIRDSVEPGNIPSACPCEHILGWSGIWLMTLIYLWYFLGTVLYVKTNIRKRSHSGWLRASVVFHLLGWAGVCLCALRGWASWWQVGLWSVIVFRAFFVPWYGKRYRWVAPRIIGIGEVVISLCLALDLLLYSY